MTEEYVFVVTRTSYYPNSGGVQLVKVFKTEDDSLRFVVSENDAQKIWFYTYKRAGLKWYSH